MSATVEIDECALDCSQLQVANGDWRQTGQRAVRLVMERALARWRRLSVAVRLRACSSAELAGARLRCLLPSLCRVVRATTLTDYRGHRPVSHKCRAVRHAPTNRTTATPMSPSLLRMQEVQVLCQGSKNERANLFSLRDLDPAVITRVMHIKMH